MLEDDIKSFLENQKLLDDEITPFELALQLILGIKKGNETYEGQEEDKKIIFSECKKMIDISNCLTKYHNIWHFKNTEIWKEMYGF